MKIEDIKEILAGNFEDENDRKYWENKLAEAERKARNSKENEEYFRKMRKYAR